MQYLLAGTVATVWRISTGWTVRGSNAGGDEIFRCLELGTEAYLVFCTMVTDSLPVRRTEIAVPRMPATASWLTFTNQYRLMLVRFASSSVSHCDCSGLSS